MSNFFLQLTDKIKIKSCQKIRSGLMSYWPFLFVLFAIFFNLVMLFPETKILMDLNDNVFAYALISRLDKTFSQILSSPPCTSDMAIAICNVHPFFYFLFSIFYFPLLLDHWTPEWAMGFPVFSYYQHIPHLTVVLLYHLISLLTSFIQLPTSSFSLLSTFNWLKYLMLSFFPLVIYYSGRKFELSKIASSSSALISTLISTNYLYGTDYNALVFRGSGMYTQAWGMFFLPLALSSIYDALRPDLHALRSGLKKVFLAVIFLSLTLAGHLVFGFIAILSTPLLFLSLRPDLHSLRSGLKKVFLILSSSFLLLSYWLIPLIANQNFQNKSFWDDLTKFNSFGALQITKWLVNGDLFDYGRWPILTILVAMGFFYSLYTFTSPQKLLPDFDQNFVQLAKFFVAKLRRGKRELTPPKAGEFPKVSRAVWLTKTCQEPILGETAKASYLLFPLLFLFWLILYFGRYTFGSLFDLLPMTEGLHIHRLINGVHLAGIFLIGLSLEWLFLLIIQFIKTRAFSLISLIALISLILFPVFRERYQYLSWNNYLINYYNNEFAKEWPSFKKVLDRIDKEGRGRIYLGRPGNWGKNFTVGGFSAYFVASVNNFSTLGFEPESWSPNTDIEQFFSENDQAYYDLFNIRYIVAPPEQSFDNASDKKFDLPSSKLNKLAQFDKFVLYQIKTRGNFDFINSDLLIFTNKNIKLNLDRLWLGSQLIPLRNHPGISYSPNFPNSPNFPKYSSSLTMLDIANYKLGKPSDNGETLDIFSQNPFPLNQLDKLIQFNQSTPSATVLSETAKDNYFSATVNTSQDSILMLRATYHPFWQVFIDSKKAEKFMVEPAFMATVVLKGQHLVEFKYYPATYKQILMLISLFTLPLLCLFLKRFKHL